jgi:N-acetyl-anhydromuramyl-L-alanine amidase AmpD
MWTWFSDWFKSFWEGLTSAPVSAPGKPAPKPAERPSAEMPAQRHLWIPYAERAPAMKSQGKYPKSYPEGLVVHFSAGSSMKSTMDWGRGQGYLFLGIDKAGKVYQTNALNEWGHHAGVSSWPGLGSSVSSKLVGVEIDNAGKLTPISGGKYKSWFGKVFDEKDVRHVTNEANRIAGTYEKYTEAQEEALIELCLWLKRNHPTAFSFDYVVGHDEVATPKGRKNDPGGALSMTMPQLRATLKAMG